MSEPAAGSDLLVVGEALVDVVVRDDQRQRHVGGSPANVAIGLARLGHSVRLATCLGHDGDGDLVRARLAADGVRLASDVPAQGRTSTATAVLDADGGATYEFDLLWDLRAVDVAGARHLHTGSIGALLAPGSRAVLEALRTARANGATTSYDPNLRPQIMRPPGEERAAVEALVVASDVVKASTEDLAWLYPGIAADDVARRWITLGPGLVVVTAGAEGATALLQGPQPISLRVPARPVAVVDTVGAGDSFMSALLSALLDAGLLGSVGRLCAPNGTDAADATDAVDVRLALERAIRASSITCSRAGSNPPTRAELGD